MKLLVFVSALLASSLSLAGTYNYAEIGLGASKWTQSTDDSVNDKEVDDLDPNATFRISTGSRIGRSINSWFELSYMYENKKDFGVTTWQQQYVLASLKFTTDPRKNASSFIKLGGGKRFLNVRENEDGVKSYSQDDRGIVQLGFGAGFRLDPKQSLIVEAQTLHFNAGGSDYFSHIVTVSLNQFL